jgi:PKD repeat protein
MLPAANAQFIANVTGATGNFTNQSTNAWTYNWNFGDASPTSNAQNPTHTYTANGTYTVTLTVTGACGTDTYTQVVTITEVGIEDADLANTLSIYPNPNDGHFTVSFEFAEAKDVSIVLTDAAGRMVTNDEQYNVMNYKREFGNEELANGIYLITITTAEGSVTRKVSIQE